jgi:hypothetical protein
MCVLAHLCSCVLVHTRIHVRTHTHLLKDIVKYQSHIHNILTLSLSHSLRPMCADFVRNYAHTCKVCTRTQQLDYCVAAGCYLHCTTVVTF